MSAAYGSRKSRRDKTFILESRSTRSTSVLLGLEEAIVVEFRWRLRRLLKVGELLVTLRLGRGVTSIPFVDYSEGCRSLGWQVDRLEEAKRMRELSSIHLGIYG